MSAPKFWESVKIGPLDFSIVCSNKERLGTASARLFYNQERIEILPDLAPRKWCVSLMHECIHAILFNSGHIKNHDESHIWSIANGMCALIQDNPEYIKHIMGSCGRMDDYGNYVDEENV